MAESEKEIFLQDISLFKGLSKEHIRELARIAHLRHFARGAFIFQEGEEARGFYVVFQGQVKVFKQAPSGREQILHLFGPGEPFGEVPVFAGERFPAHAVALTACKVYCFPRKDFVTLIQKDPSLALNLLAVLSRRLRQFVALVEALSLKEVSERLAAYLVYRQEKAGALTFDLGMNKTQLASFLGTVPETVSRVFKKFQQQGVLESKGREVTIHHREALQEIAAGLRPLD